MKNNIKFLIVIGILILIIILNLTGCTYRLTGTVDDRDSGSPIEGAKIELTYDSDSSIQYSAYTDANGSFYMSNIEGAHHTAMVSKYGYQSISDSIDFAASTDFTIPPAIVDRYYTLVKSTN